MAINTKMMLDDTASATPKKTPTAPATNYYNPGAGASTLGDYNAQVAAKTPTVNTGGQGIVLSSDGKTVLSSDNPNVPVGDTTSPTYGKTPTGNTTPKVSNVAFDVVAATLSSYGMVGLADKMAEVRALYPEISSGDLLLLLKTDTRFNKPYLDRFSGNAQRISQGLAPLDDATYLKQEASYKKLFTAYGMNQFANQASYANLIANDVSPDEANTRVTIAFDRVLGDKSTLNAFNEFYPTIKTSDIASTMLDPKTQLPALQRQVTAAEIGGQALKQGLQGSLLGQVGVDQAFANVEQGTLGAQTLAAEGITKAQAAQGYQNIAEVLPTAEKLSSIYAKTTDQYGQLQAEQEQFQGLASAKRKRQQLTTLETAAFSGSSGASKGAFSTNYLNRQSAAGQI